MLPRHKCNTLDAAGYTYNPYTKMDTFGHPSGLSLTALEQHELPIGADNSAIPVLGDHSVRNRNIPVGSDMVPPYKGLAADQRRSQAATQANVTLIGFIAILVLALWLKLPGSP